MSSLTVGYVEISNSYSIPFISYQYITYRDRWFAVLSSSPFCHVSVSKSQENENEIAFYKTSEVLNLKKNENGINGVFKVISGFLLFSTDA